jgi:hypothetical protein
MTYFAPAYDTELFDTDSLVIKTSTCLEACYQIVEMHHRYNVPATFFILGKALESAPREYRELLDDPLFEVASHSYSHQMLRDQPICGPAAEREIIHQEIFLSKQVIEDVFGRPCLGFRPGCGFERGLESAPEILNQIQEAGYSYVSTRLWGKDYSLPAPLTQAYPYVAEGYPDVWEIPGHGWHENLLKGNNRVFGVSAVRALLFPPEFPEAIPPGVISTPEEEFRYNNRFFIDKACSQDLEYVSLIWHPWSLYLFDPEMKMLEMTFTYLREHEIPSRCFQDIWKSKVDSNSL